MASITNHLDKMVIGVSSPDGNMRPAIRSWLADTNRRRSPGPA